MKSALASNIDALIASQATAWPMLARGLRGLLESQTRPVMVAGRLVWIRHIPHRIVSTTAAVDAASIARRPCFLCAANLPAEEAGLAFDSDFTVYCNPFPILERHLTIVHTQHRPQLIAGSLEAMLRLAQSLDEYFIIYNGPRCGASAPDHLHFQACSRSTFPIEEDLNGVSLTIPDYARRTLVFRDSDPQRLNRKLYGVIQAFGKLVPFQDEPLLNIAAFYKDAVWTVILFPRGKHRPGVYETGELTVSPATIDLCGVFVVPVAEHYERITGGDIERIFAEVTLSQTAFDLLLAGMGAPS